MRSLNARAASAFRLRFRSWRPARYRESPGSDWAHAAGGSGARASAVGAGAAAAREALTGDRAGATCSIVVTAASSDNVAYIRTLLGRVWARRSRESRHGAGPTRLVGTF